MKDFDSILKASGSMFLTLDQVSQFGALAVYQWTQSYNIALRHFYITHTASEIFEMMKIDRPDDFHWQGRKAALYELLKRGNVIKHAYWER